MENNPGDSSSESDISDPWSIVGPEEIPGENSGRDSISGEPSDGESLEVIDEEERHEEFTVKDVGMETDGISVITESEISDELEEPLPAAVSKDKKYLHHPNTFLNNSLTVLLVISCAGVAGLGLGHFLGLQEECPILNESTNNLITKLQQENDLLRKELYELHNAKRDYMQCKGWECGSKSNLKEIDASYKYLGLKSEIENNLQLENAIYAKDFPHHSGNEFAGKHENIMNLVQDNRNIIDAEHKEQIDFDKVQKYTDDSNDLISIIEIKDQDDNLRNSPDDSSDLISIIQIKDQDDNLRNSVQQNADSLRFVGDVDIQDVKNNLLNKEDEQVRYIEESTVEENTNSKEELFQYDIFNNFMFNKLNEAIYKNVVLNNEKHSLEKDNAEAVEDKVYVYPSTEEDRVKTESQEKETSSEHVIETSDSFSQQSFIYPEKIPKHIVKEKNQWEENDLQQIKSTLELLKIHFHNDISPETGYVLSSAITLATEYEQDLAKLQETIANCKIKQSNFCIQFHKKMEVSVSKLKETSEELAEDIDEQMYKLLAKIARKLKKFKVNVQNKWCHLKNKYDNAEGWFQSSIFKDCKENNKQHEKMFSKTYETSHDAFKKDNIEENQNARKIIENSFKNSDIESSFKNENSQHREKKQEKVLKHKESHMKELYAKGEHRMHDKKYFQKKENKNEYKNNKCNERGNDKYCKENENKYSGSKKIKKHDHNNGNKEFKKNKVNNENEEKYNKQFITVDQSRTWPKFDSNSQKQNVSGDWILKMADDRAEQRKLNQRSDWLFDRADGRKVQRDRHHSTDNWYFERARGRDNCRYSAHSNCKSGPNYDWHQHRYERENEEKLHYGHRWTKKMIPRAFATAGKWMKDTFSKFENKFNYHSQH